MTTTITSLPAPVQSWFDKVLLSRYIPTLIHTKFALKKRLPARNSTTVVYRRYNNLSEALVPLGASGLTPAPQQLSAVDISATVNWYGKQSCRSKIFSDILESLREAA